MPDHSYHVSRNVPGLLLDPGRYAAWLQRVGPDHVAVDLEPLRRGGGLTLKDIETAVEALSLRRGEVNYPRELIMIGLLRDGLFVVPRDWEEMNGS